MVSCECYFACWSAPEVILFSRSFHLLLNPGYRICLASCTKHSISAHTGTVTIFFTSARWTFTRICRLYSLLFCQLQQIKIKNHFHPDCHQHHPQRIDRYHYFCPHSIFQTVQNIQNNLTPIPVNAVFVVVVLDTFQHSGRGQAWLIKTFPRSEWTTAGEVDKIALQKCTHLYDDT